MLLEGKVALVTGAARGMGRVFAQRLAKEGAAVAVVDRLADGVAETCDLIRGAGGKAHGIVADLQDVERLPHIVAETAAQLGGLDILVNNAGVMQTKPLLDITVSEWDFIQAVNVRAVFFMLQAAAKHMIQQGRGGRIINMASVAGKGARPLAAAYAASKAAVISITRSAAQALAPYNILVNAICPGVVLTDMWKQIDQERQQLFGLQPGEATRQMVESIPLKRAAELDEVADLVAFLAGPHSTYISGESITIDGAYDPR